MPCPETCQPSPIASSRPTGIPDLDQPSAGRQVVWSWLGRQPYGPVFARQEQIRRELKEGRGPEHLLLLEHEPVYTIGRNADESDVLADRQWLQRSGVEVRESNRGGQVTYHGPGQLVGYPIVSLDPDRRDVRLYVRNLQDVLIRTLADFGIAGRRRRGKEFIGVWVGDEKIACYRRPSVALESQSMASRSTSPHSWTTSVALLPVVLPMSS